MFRTLLVHHYRIHLLLYKTVTKQGCSREFTAETILCQTTTNSACVSSTDATNMIVVLFSMKSGNLNLLEPSGPYQACNGTTLPLPYTSDRI